MKFVNPALLFCLFASSSFGAVLKDDPAPASGARPWPGADLLEEVTPGFESLQAVTLSFDKVQSASGQEANLPQNLRRYAEVQDGLTFMPLDTGSGEFRRSQQVSLPHQWDLPQKQAAGWYLLKVNLTKQADRLIAIRFERVVIYCDVYVNGRKAGSHLGGYDPFQFDITGLVNDGENNIAIFVHDQSGAVDGEKAYAQLAMSRPESGVLRGGIFSTIKFIEQQPIRVSDCFVKTSWRNKTIEVELELKNDSSQPASGSVDLQVVNWPDGTAADLNLEPVSFEIEPGQTLVKTINEPWASPRLWSPEHPNLYVLHSTVQSGESYETVSTRFGFREFWIDGKQFVLNGIPIRLRGESVYEPRDNPDANTVEFNKMVFEIYKKELAVNACRSHLSIPPHEVFLAADEVGVLMINQSAVWSNMVNHYRRAGEEFLVNAEKEFESWIKRDRNCPSVVIWDSENEMIRGYRENLPWVLRLDEFIRRWDTTRPISHSGAGWYHESQQLIHVHMHEHYSWLLDKWAKSGTMPIIFGEYWIGGRGEKRLPSSKEYRSEDDYYEEEARLYQQMSLEMRYYGASGVMPFTIRGAAFETDSERGFWEYVPGKGIEYEPRSPQATGRIRHALQPITAFFWPRIEAAEIGKQTSHEVVVCNDSETTQTLEVQWNLAGMSPQSQTLNLSPAQQWRAPFRETVTVQQAMELRLLKDGDVVATDTLPLRLYSPAKSDAPKNPLLVYGNKSDDVQKALKDLGLTAQQTQEIPEPGKPSVLIIPPAGGDEQLKGQSRQLRQFLEQGGRLVVLAQGETPKWLPIRLPFWSGMRDVPNEFAMFDNVPNQKNVYFARHAPIYAKSHPLFAGINHEDLRWWNGFDGRVSDDALVRPSAVNDFVQGAWRVLAGASRRENISIAEARVGKGLLLLCQAQVIEQWQNAEARTLFANLLKYADGEAWQTPATPIKLAGDLSAEHLNRMTGVDVSNFGETDAAMDAIMIAGDNASPEAVMDWARAGGRVLVLSAKTSGLLEGLHVKDSDAYSATANADHPMFWGVTAILFSNLKTPIINGEFSEYPSTANVLLAGLAKGKNATWGPHEMFREAGPVAVSYKVGNGEIIATTLEPWKSDTPQARELLSLLLTNAGASIPPPERQVMNVRALRTIPLKMDGQLDDWTDDVEDRNVSPYVHAVPLVMAAEDAVAGAPTSDAQFSAIAYFLWDQENLYTAAAIFGAHDHGNATIRLGENLIRIRINSSNSEVMVNGRSAPGAQIAQSLNARNSDYVDSRLLSFVEIDKRIGHLKTIEVPALSYEIKIPWRELGLETAPESLPVMVQFQKGDDMVLQSPPDANPQDAATFITLTMEK